VILNYHIYGILYMKKSIFKFIGAACFLTFIIINIIISGHLPQKSKNGYVFKNIDGTYKVVDGPNYINKVIIFTNNNGLTFNNEYYEYAFDGDYTNYSLTVTFPDGGSCYYSSSNISYGSNTTYDPIFIGDAIVTLQLQPPIQNMLIEFLIIIVGIIMLFFPDFVFRVSLGLMFKNLEISTLYIFILRCFGVVLSVCGSIAFIYYKFIEW